MRKTIKASLFLLGLVASTLVFNHKTGTEVKGEFAPEGMVAYAASYASDITNEPKYSTQNSTTFQYLNLGSTLSTYRGDSVKVGIIDSGRKKRWWIRFFSAHISPLR